MSASLINVNYCSIFVPSEGNALADILLSRGVNGESPIKKRAPRKKSAVTPKPRPSAASGVARSKTPRAGAPKRAARKSSAIPGHGDENQPPAAKKRNDTSNPARLSEGRRTHGAPLRPKSQQIRLIHSSPLYICAIWFILCRHGRWYLCRPLSTAYHFTTGAFGRPARGCQCVPLYHSNLNPNV